MLAPKDPINIFGKQEDVETPDTSATRHDDSPHQLHTCPKAYKRSGSTGAAKGLEVVTNRHVNKGSAFSREERDDLCLHGLLPPTIECMETQLERCEALMRDIKMSDRKMEMLFKYQYLSHVRIANETLFYALLQRNIKDFMPIVYTPTVGLACQSFSHIFNQSSEGIYLSMEFTEKEIRRILSIFARQKASPSIVVVTDGSRILGLGDLGVNGMGIPIGKLALYVAAGGFHPLNILPITIDMGTNSKYLDDPYYLGKKTTRPSDAVFYAFTDLFMKVISELFPDCVIQFEDFENSHCFELLSRNRTKYRCFNDDIQGTGVVAAAGILSAMRYVEKEDNIKLDDHKFVFHGFGSATAGVINEIVSCLHLKSGRAKEELAKMFYCVDSRGLCTRSRGDILAEYKIPFARSENDLPHGGSLEETIKFVKPTALIGLSGQGRSFSKEIVQHMAEFNKHPIIFALSNPTSNAECMFHEAMEWTNGTVVYAAGSPMNPVGDRISPQGNNLYAFPGIGYGAWMAQAKSITDEMMNVATMAISNQVEEKDLLNIYPPLDQVSEVSNIVAAEVMRVALENGLNECEVPDTHEGRLQKVKAERYNPCYE